MESEDRTTLDDAAFRARLNRRFTQPNYVRRPITRTPPVILGDVDIRQRHSPTNGTPGTLLPVTTASALQLNQPEQARATNPSNPNFTAQANHTFSRPAINTLVTERPSGHAPPLSKHNNKLRLSLTVLAIGIVLAGSYISFIKFRASHLSVAQTSKLTAQVLSPYKPSIPSEYIVAPNLPRYIIIPELGINELGVDGVAARVLSVGVNSQGSLETPTNIDDTAWYNKSARPGQPGAMLIDGHVSNQTTQGVFYGINNLVAGDIIKIVRGNGTTFTYTVVKNQILPSDNVNITSLTTPVVAGQPGLNLVSCPGDVIPGTSQSNELIVVYATLNQ